MTLIPRPRDLPDGFTIQAFRQPLMANCLFVASISSKTSRTFLIKCSALIPRKLETGAHKDSSSSPFLAFGFFFFFFSSTTTVPFILSFSFCRAFSFFSLSRMASVGTCFLLMKSWRSSAFTPLSRRWVQSSRQTCSSTAHSFSDTFVSASASSGLSITSAGSVTSLKQTLYAKRTTSLLKVMDACESRFLRNSLRIACALVNLKLSANSARSPGS
mmetsp:Transcript_51099/g.119099  ORF Transcript_51099/g.119099 Transcript_51099/m.119099 type:complete len:216 (-) Transcript_51099:577-1224(-)